MPAEKNETGLPEGHVGFNWQAFVEGTVRQSSSSRCPIGRSLVIPTGGTRHYSPSILRDLAGGIL